MTPLIQLRPLWFTAFRVIVLVLVVIGAMDWIRTSRSIANAQSVDQKPLPASIYDFDVVDIDEKPVSLGKWRGKVLLIVNVASKCGFTGQYVGLQKLYETYREKGFEIFGFPSNDFLWQEPASNKDIKFFCMTKYKVSFPMFAKISVKGSEKHPLYQFLTDPSRHTVKVDEISWNFNKFLIDRSGKVLAQFGSTADPQSPELIAAVENALKETAVASSDTSLPR
ncbi:MAG: glutathione peroxidase [Candidatus Ozemobacteraceae bacterium]